jgi:hypothetical protein
MLQEVKFTPNHDLNRSSYDTIALRNLLHGGILNILLRVGFFYEREFYSPDHPASGVASRERVLVVYRGPHRTTKFTVLWSAATDSGLVDHCRSRSPRYSGLTEGLLCLNNLLLLRL